MTNQETDEWLVSHLKHLMARESRWAASDMDEARAANLKAFRRAVALADEIARLTREREIVTAAIMARVPNAPSVVEALQQFVRQWNACGPNSDFGRYFNCIYEVAVDALAKYQMDGEPSQHHEPSEEERLRQTGRILQGLDKQIQEKSGEQHE